MQYSDCGGEQVERQHHQQGDAGQNHEQHHQTVDHAQVEARVEPGAMLLRKF